MRILITGSTGFVGRHLAAELLRHDHDVIGTTLGPVPQDFPISSNRIFNLDITSRDQVLQLIDRVQPEAVIHLAGIATTPHRSEDAAQLFEINVRGTENVAYGVQSLNADASLLVISSAFVYGGADHTGRHRYSENSPTIPRGIYGASKLAAEYAAQLFSSDLCRVYIARPFNHIGVGQDPSFVVAGLAERIKHAKNGEAIETGSLEAFRDFTDVRDVVRGYRKIIEMKPKERCFVFGSGNSYQIKEVFERLCKLADKNLTHQIKKSLVRENDQAEYLADYSLAEKILGWRPEISLEKGLADVWAAVSKA